MKTLDYVTCKQAWLDFDFVLGGISNIFCISFTMFSWTLTSFLLPCSSTNTSQIVSWQRYYNYISQFCISLTSWWCLRQLHHLCQFLWCWLRRFLFPLRVVKFCEKDMVKMEMGYLYFHWTELFLPFLGRWGLCFE